MTGYQRVRVALGGRPPDRVARGELALAAAVAAALAGRPGLPPPPHGPERWRLEEAALRVLGSDMVGVFVSPLPGEACGAVPGGRAGPGGPSPGPAPPPASPAWRGQLAYWAGRDLFVWAVVDGPWQGLAAALGWSEAFMLLGRSSPPPEAEGLLVLQLDRALTEAREALGAGADGIVMGEDVAYGEGLLLAPPVIRERLWPLWREVVAGCRRERTVRGEPPLVVFHSDGRIGGLLGEIREAGFDGVHSLEPEAGMDAAALTEQYRGQLGLLGGLSLDLLGRGTPEAVAEEARRLARAAARGGLVVGSAAGVIPEGVPVGNLLAAYRALEGREEGEFRAHLDP